MNIRTNFRKFGPAANSRAHFKSLGGVYFQEVIVKNKKLLIGYITKYEIKALLVPGCFEIKPLQYNRIVEQ